MIIILIFQNNLLKRLSDSGASIRKLIRFYLYNFLPKISIDQTFVLVCSKIGHNYIVGIEESTCDRFTFQLRREMSSYMCCCIRLTNTNRLVLLLG